MSFTILSINPGATSTKIGIFTDDKLVSEESIRHSDADLQGFVGIMAQLPFRVAAITSFLQKNKINTVAAVVGRGGLLKPLPSGTYLVNKTMLDELILAERGEHASNLGAHLAHNLAQKFNCQAFIVDPVAVDEMLPIARITGVKGIERESLSHALNMKAIAKRHAASVQKKYQDLRLIVVHMGTGISISAHQSGKMIDVTNPKDEGPLSADRAGSLPSTALINLCYREGATQKQVKNMIFGNGGLFSHLGNRDLREILESIESGNKNAELVVNAMCYQVGKFIGQMAVVLEGRVDWILLTGGMVYNRSIIDNISKRVDWIAKIHAYPGEDELQSLAEGAWRVLTGAEAALNY